MIDFIFRSLRHSLSEKNQNEESVELFHVLYVFSYHERNHHQVEEK